MNARRTQSKRRGRFNCATTWGIEKTTDKDDLQINDANQTNREKFKHIFCSRCRPIDQNLFPTTKPAQDHHFTSFTLKAYGTSKRPPLIYTFIIIIIIAINIIIIGSIKNIHKQQNHLSRPNHWEWERERVMDSNCFYHILLYIFIILKGKWVITFLFSITRIVENSSWFICQENPTQKKTKWLLYYYSVHMYILIVGLEIISIKVSVSSR